MLESQTKLYVVVQSVGGYAREDAPKPVVAGAYYNAEKAELIRQCAGLDALVHEVLVDVVPPGYAQTARELYPERADALL